MSWWGRQNQQVNLRDRQIQGLKQNPAVTEVQPGSRYEIKFNCRHGQMSFFVDLPPGFPQTAPIFKFLAPVQHSWVNPQGFIQFQELARWSVHASVNILVATCIKQFVSNPPQPRQNAQKFRPPPQYGQYQPPASQYGQQKPPGQYGQPGGYQPKPAAQQQPPSWAAQPQIQQPISDSGRQSSTQSNVEPDEPFELGVQVPQSFPIVDQMATEELQNLLNNEEVIRDLALDCNEYKCCRELQDQFRLSLRKETEANLHREPEVSAQRQRLEQARAEVDTLHKKHQGLAERQKRVLQKYSVQAIESELDTAIMEVNDECAAMKESFENEDIKVAKYVNTLIKLKTLTHMRQIKKARLETL